MIVSVARSSAGVATGISAALDPGPGTARAARVPCRRFRESRVEDHRLAVAEQLEQISPRQRLGPREQCARRRRRARRSRATERATSLAPRSSGMRITAASTPSSTIDDASTSRVVPSDRLCAKVREISLRVQPLRLLPLGGERFGQLVVELGHPLVQPRVLDGDRQLRGQSGESRARSSLRACACAGRRRGRRSGRRRRRGRARSPTRSRSPAGARTSSNRSSAVTSSNSTIRPARRDCTAAARSAWAIDS